MDRVEATNYFAKIMNKCIQNLLLVVSGIVTIVDTVSDVVLAVDYCVTDNPWWCGLTWIFIVLPLLTFLIILVIGYQTSMARQVMWKFWKCTEICFESGPQLILQLYILEQSERDSTTISGKVVANILHSSMFSHFSVGIAIVKMKRKIIVPLFEYTISTYCDKKFAQSDLFLEIMW